eukprot:TRINITY_DN9308_c2_g1_i1.p1 TRINITY_DN9308_c2_g1~~TRINITY_DN9308_c2_g1_i1.p1  ORF type:complete len:512 (+),score=107.10 TRINITY_DN9308_c2_g1_i1:65-1600(+)
MAPKKAAKVEISEVTGKPKIVRQDRGREAAKLQATMTKEEWLKYRTEEYAKKWPIPDYMHDLPPVRHVRDGGEGAYRDQTYMIVTRWTEKTRIQYRPHAKAPGSKSHVRYEKYAKAKTVGEALKLGSYPLDWCFDYEHGFIKVLGGTIRDEPIDPTTCPDLSKLTDVDNCLLQWYRRELAKKYGLKPQDLICDGEPMMLRAHRLQANRHAEKVLASAEREKRLIREDEVESVLSLWGFARNVTRQNVLPQDKEWVWSDTVGLLRDRMGDIHLTKSTIRYPAVCQVLNQWLTHRLPKEAEGFKFTTLNLNKNYAAKRHRDGNNFGPSIIKGFGDYKQGELHVFPSDDRSITDLAKLPQSDRVTLDIKKNLAMFNGNSAHEVSEYIGDRYSVVYFTVGCHAQMSDENRRDLAAMGFAVPDADEDPTSILSAPSGYKRPVARPAAKTSTAVSKRSAGSGLKPLRTWPISSLNSRGKLSNAKFFKGQVVMNSDGGRGSKKGVLKKVLKKPAAQAK